MSCATGIDNKEYWKFINNELEKVSNNTPAWQTK
jgi:hypothetical protein